MFSKNKEVIQILPRQLEELEAFYKKLGYSSGQVKKLCSSCFGAKIVPTDQTTYRKDWEFPRRREDFFLERMGGVPGGFSPMMGGARAMASMPAPMMEASVPMMRAPEPMVEMEEGVAAPEFNTAETHDAPEIEAASPLDDPRVIFSANVNTASWSYIRNRIRMNSTIDRSFVRIEEIINSFPYRLKKPKGEELFSISTEKAACPWDEDAELMFVGLKGKKASKKVHQNLAFLVDVSGSMEDRWMLVQMSLASIVSKLGKGDVISIIAYSDETTTVVKNLPCDNPDKCIKAILSIDGIGGCTNGSQGLEDAYRFLEKNFDKEANNRVFIFTDGDFNFGVTGEGGLAEYIYKKRETGIYLSVVGYGYSNFKDNKMEALARNGNGNYTFISAPEDILEHLWENLVSELVTIAKDVKISIEMNPHFVKEYRLIGYDARVLTQQEFNDTEKAVDGIGSEHNVVALIQLKKGEATHTYSSRYVNTSATANTEELAFVEIHYKSPDGTNKVMTHVITMEDYEKAAGQNAEAAALMAAFGLLIRDSAYKGTLDGELLGKLISNVEKDEYYDKAIRASHLSVIEDYLK